MTNNEQPMVFPSNAGKIVFDLLEKYKIHETSDIIASKFQNNEPTNGRKVAILLQAIVKKEMPADNLATELQTQLKIPANIAQSIDQELKQKVLNQMSKSIPPATVQLKTKTPESFLSDDPYKEPVE